MEQMTSAGINADLVPEADDDTLIKRYSSRVGDTLSGQGGILRQSRQSGTAPIHRTGHHNRGYVKHDLADLRRELLEIVSHHTKIKKLLITVISFGFKHGLPKDADLVFDVRFLPNPHYVHELQPLTGLEPQVSKFVLDSPLTKRFLRHLTAFMDFLLPNFIEEGKTHLTVAIGCTGGQHRSVAIAETLKSYFESKEHMVVVEHRDIHIGESGGPDG